MRFANCRGAILVEDANVSPLSICAGSGSYPCVYALGADACDRVAVKESILHGGVLLENHVGAVIERCSLPGHGGGWVGFSTPGVHATNGSNVQIVESTLHGGDGVPLAVDLHPQR